MRPSTKFSIGIIGIGNMGRNHARVASSHHLVNRVAVFDMDTARSGAVAAEYGIEQTACIDALIDTSDAVVIASPTITHFDIAKRVLNKGRHCLIEKPIAATAAEAEQLVELADKSGCKVAIGHIERHNPVFSELQKILASETVHAVSGSRLSFNLSRANDVSVVFDLMIHDIDTVCEIIDSTMRLQSAVGAAYRSVELDYATALMTSATGVNITLAASKISQTRVRKILISCSDCYIEADYLKKEIEIYRHATGKYINRIANVGYRQESFVEKVLVPSIEPLAAEHTDFYKSIIDDREPLVHVRDGQRAFDIALSVQKACVGNAS